VVAFRLFLFFDGLVKTPIYFVVGQELRFAVPPVPKSTLIRSLRLSAEPISRQFDDFLREYHSFKDGKQ